MTFEELMELSADALKAKADELGIEYKARANKTELSELIYAEINDPKGASEVAQGNEANSNGLLSEEDFEIVDGQLIKVTTLKDGEKVETLTSLDDFIRSFEPLLNENIGLLNENDTLKKENAQLKIKNAELEKEAFREVIGHPSQAPEEVVKLKWNGKDSMKVRARVAPNKGVVTRMRAGLSFGVQYSEYEVDKKTFDALIADDFIQVDVLEQADE